jgi:hypothetical protein
MTTPMIEPKATPPMALAGRPAGFHRLMRKLSADPPRDFLPLRGCLPRECALLGGRLEAPGFDGDEMAADADDGDAGDDSRTYMAELGAGPGSLRL